MSFQFAALTENSSGKHCLPYLSFWQSVYYKAILFSFIITFTSMFDKSHRQHAACTRQHRRACREATAPSGPAQIKPTWCKKVGLVCFTPCRESDLMMVPGQSTFHQGTITVLRVFRERCRLADGQQTTSLAAQRGGVQQVNDVFHGLVRAACKGITALVQIFHFYLVVYDAPVIIDTQDKLGPNNCCKGKLNVSIKRNVDRIQNRCTCV